MQNIEAVNGIKTHPVLSENEEVLVYKDDRIIVRHGIGNTTSTGNPELNMVVGTTEEIEAEIERLGLKTEEELF